MSDDRGQIVVLFAGWGGADEGIVAATGREPDVAINHDEIALAVHRANHPRTRHLCGDVYHYDPRDVCGSGRVWMLWASPTCTHFSKAKGGPLDRREASRVRALAWVVTRWAREVRPSVIFLENVEAFQGWGPLANDGKPDPAKRGSTFRRWVRSLEKLGYVVEWRELRADDYGAPTSRKRLFVVARCDGRPIVWPQPTHGPGRDAPHRGAFEVLDFSIPAPSIFARKKPLVAATLRRIARGMQRFVFGAAEPFIIPVSHAGDARVHSIREPLRTVTASSRSPFHLVVPYLIHVSNGERQGQAPRVYDIREPLGTVVAGGIKHGLVFAFMMKNFGGHESPGLPLTAPLGTVTTRDHHALVVCSTVGDRRRHVMDLLSRYSGTATSDPQMSLDLFGSIAGRQPGRSPDGVVRFGGASYVVADVGARLLVPRELARAHDFGDDRALERDADGRPISTTKQVRLIGNSVPKKPAEALVAANVGREAIVA